MPCSVLQDDKKGSILKSYVSKGAQLRIGKITAPQSTLAAALTGIDVIVSAYSGPNLVADQLNLLAAAVKAGVKRFVPSDFIGDLSKHTYAFGLTLPVLPECRQLKCVSFHL